MIKTNLWDSVAKGNENDCWPWTAAQNGAGYGYRRVGNKMMLAHRVIFQEVYGYMPAVVMHKCDNPICVNPGHLQAGTYKENTRDMWEKGRQHNPNTVKLQCKNGHPFDEENTRYTDTQRVCRTCERERMRRRRAK